MLYVRLERQLVEVPDGDAWRTTEDDFEVIGTAGEVLMRCFVHDVIGCSYDRHELVSDLLEEGQEDQATDPDWDGSEGGSPHAGGARPSTGHAGNISASVT